MNQSNAVYPDCTILLDLPLEVGFKRKEIYLDISSRDIPNIENNNEALAYVELVNIFPNWQIIDSSMSTELVAKDIWSYIYKYIFEQGDE